MNKGRCVKVSFTIQTFQFQIYIAKKENGFRDVLFDSTWKSAKECFVWDNE